MRTHRRQFRWLTGLLLGALGLGLGAVPPADSARLTPAGVMAPAGRVAPKGKALGHVPGRLMVKLKPTAALKSLSPVQGMVVATDDDVLAKVRALKGFKAMRPQFPGSFPPKRGQPLMARDGKLVPTPDLTRWHRVDLDEAEDVLARVAEVKQLPGVEVAEPDYLRKMADIPLPDATTDPKVKDQWHLAAVHAPEAWAYLKSQGLPPGGSRDVIVAVIDTGIDMTHPDLAANLWTAADGSHGYNAITGTTDPTDDHGHGTHVAGIIAAQGNNGVGGVGIAYNVQIMAIKAAQYSGALTTTDIANGIIWAVTHGADVINMSFGGYGRSVVEEETLLVAFGQAVLVAAAGNDGLPNEWEKGYPDGKAMYPAAYSWVLGVMASTQSGARTSFSNWDLNPNNSIEYELTAPGVSIWSTLPNGQYAAWSGTSMSAPVVSGIAGLIRTQYPNKNTHPSRFIMGQLAVSGANALVAVNTTPQPRLAYLEHWLFDAQSINAINNNNGRVDAGETIDLAISVRNQWGKADNVVVKLEPYSIENGGIEGFVTMLAGQQNYGAVGSFGTDDNGLIPGPRPNFLDHQEGVINGKEGSKPLRSSRRKVATHFMLLLQSSAGRVGNA